MLDQISLDQYPALISELFMQMREQFYGANHVSVRLCAGADALVKEICFMAWRLDIPLQLPLWWSNDQLRGASSRTMPRHIRWLTADITDAIRSHEDRIAYEHHLQNVVRNSLGVSPQCASIVHAVIYESNYARIADDFADIREGNRSAS